MLLCDGFGGSRGSDEGFGDASRFGTITASFGGGGAEFDHIWMLSHRPGRLWSCWCGAILDGFDRSLDQANGRNR